MAFFVQNSLGYVHEQTMKQSFHVDLLEKSDSVLRLDENLLNTRMENA